MRPTLKASPPPETFDLRDLGGIQPEIEDVEILPHVAGVGRPGQGDHADVEGEPEHDLATVRPWRSAIRASSGRASTSRLAVSSEKPW